MAKEEEAGSPSWAASFFTQTTGDVIRVAAPAVVSSPMSPVVHSSKDDNSGSKLQRLQYQVTKMLKGFSRPPDVENINYNPEILTSLKRQWAANFQLQHMDNQSWKEPSRLFESMVVVGLHPNCDVQALQRQYVDRKFEGSGKLSSVLSYQNQSRVEPNIEPQVLFVYPPEKQLPLKCKDLLSFCFPGGLEVRAVERTPSMSELKEIIFGQEHLKQRDLSFVFRLQGADNSILYGCCVLVEELVQKPSGLLSLIPDKQPSYPSLRRHALITQRCYCILSRLPFFELHFGVLNSIFTQERLEWLTKSVGDLNLEVFEGNYEDENSDSDPESVVVGDRPIEDRFDGNSIISQSRVENSAPENNASDGYSENLMVSGEVQTYNESYDNVVPAEPETDRSRTAVKEESSPSNSRDSDQYGDVSIEDRFDGNSIISQSRGENSAPENNVSDGFPENLMVSGEVQTYNERINYDNVVPAEPETDRGRTAVKEESSPSNSRDSDQYGDGPIEDRFDGNSIISQSRGENSAPENNVSDGFPENLMVSGEVQTYNERINCDNGVPAEPETDRSRTAVKEESSPSNSRDSDQYGDGPIEDRFDGNSIISQSRGENSAPENNVSDGFPENLMVSGEVQTYNERINYDNVVPTEPETDRSRTAVKEESSPSKSRDSDQYGDALATNKKSKDSHLPHAILPLLRNCQYESSESSCSIQGSPCEDKNFRSEVDDNETEDASFSGQEDINDLNDILQWAKEHNHGPLQIISEYYRLSCPARGSTLTFHPLEHLHLLEYHRPAGTVPHLVGSTVDLKACNAGQELANAHNSLLVEDATALSIWTVACICGILRLENVLTFFAGVLLERQIVVLSSNLGILSASVLSVIPLIQPYRWQSLLMPVLPSDMHEFLDAPVPYVVGITNKNSEVQSKFAGVILVDADRNQVKSPTIPQLPRQKELVSSLRSYHATLVGESYLGRRRPVYECTEVQIEAAKGFLSVLRSYLDSLCNNIRSHTITNVQSNDDKVSLLLKESFIDSFPYRDRAFMKLFVDTQLFSVHTDLVLSFLQKE